MTRERFRARYEVRLISVSLGRPVLVEDGDMRSFDPIAITPEAVLIAEPGPRQDA